MHMKSWSVTHQQRREGWSTTTQLRSLAELDSYISNCQQLPRLLQPSHLHHIIPSLVGTTILWAPKAEKGLDVEFGWMHWQRDRERLMPAMGEGAVQIRQRVKSRKDLWSQERWLRDSDAPAVPFNLLTTLKWERYNYGLYPKKEKQS
jgi:hypothetical protein